MLAHLFRSLSAGASPLGGSVITGKRWRLVSFAGHPSLSAVPSVVPDRAPYGDTPRSACHGLITSDPPDVPSFGVKAAGIGWSKPATTGDRRTGFSSLLRLYSHAGAWCYNEATR